jgi:hypothetical protein
MEGIPVLTEKGRDAVKSTSTEITPLCRNILIQIDGKRSIADIKTMFRGLKNLDEAMQRLFDGGFVHVTTRECKDLVTALAQEMLGVKSQTLIKKIDELHAQYGRQCWEHLEEVNKLARLFYGEVVATQLRQGIEKILQETSK